VWRGRPRISLTFNPGYELPEVDGKLEMETQAALEAIKNALFPPRKAEAGK
jgi:hypothetical protein